MKFNPARLHGAWLIEPSPYRDERGSFSRTFCLEAFGKQGLQTLYPQHSVATTALAGTVRGMHFQVPPHAEEKVVRCISGAIVDVIVDLRPESPTYLQWQAFELSAANGHQVYVPKGFAHGCQTIDDNTSVQYLISTPHAPEAASGVRYNDPQLRINWPLAVTVVSDRDLAWPLIEK
jgi:dTDP-4-dehydrorhamnose 3,5-epimerase